MPMEIHPRYEPTSDDVTGDRPRSEWPVEDEGTSWWDTDAGDGWTASARVIPGANGRPAIVEFCFTTDATDTGGLTSTRLRKFRFGDFARSILQRYYDAPDPSNVVDVSGQPTLVDPHDWVETVTAAGFDDIERLSGLEPRRGRPRRPNLDYLNVAVRYVTALESDKHAGRPVKAIADEMGESIEYVRGLLNRARELDLLSRPPRPGVPGGSLTEKGREMLRRIQEQVKEDES